MNKALKKVKEKYRIELNYNSIQKKDFENLEEFKSKIKSI